MLDKTMPTICAVSGCKSRAGADDLSFFRFPADPARRKRWEDALGRQGWKAKDHTRVCSRHFMSGKPENKHIVEGAYAHYW